MIPMESNPPWADRILTKYYDRIVEVMGPDMAPIRKAKANIGMGIQMLPPRDSEPKRSKAVKFEEYGEGHYGVTYPTRTKGVVFKITTDETEANFVAVMQALKLELPGVVVYYRIISLPDESHRKRPVFLIWREEADLIGSLVGLRYPKNYEERELIQATQKVTQFKSVAHVLREKVTHASNVEKVLEDALKNEDRAWKWVREVDRPFVPGRGELGLWAAIQFQILQDIATELANEAPLYYIGQAMERLLEERIVLADVHLNNVGFVDRTKNENLDPDYQLKGWVITDPGHMLWMRTEPLRVKFEVM